MNKEKIFKYVGNAILWITYTAGAAVNIYISVIFLQKGNYIILIFPVVAMFLMFYDLKSEYKSTKRMYSLLVMIFYIIYGCIITAFRN